MIGRYGQNIQQIKSESEGTRVLSNETTRERTGSHCHLEESSGALCDEAGKLMASSRKREKRNVGKRDVGSKERRKKEN